MNITDDNKIIPQPHEILYHAEEFRKAAKRLKGEEELNQKLITIPYCVYSAFTVEIYLKYLLYVNEVSMEKLKSHNLYNLFCHDIMSKYREQIIQKTLLKIDFPDFNKEEFYKQLKKFKNAFNILRYAYEYSIVSYGNFLELLADSLSEVCKENY